MSKMTTRDYKNIAKRPSKRGYGRAVLREMPKVDLSDLSWEEGEMEFEVGQDVIDNAEQYLAELVDGEAEVETPPEHKHFEQPQTLGSIDKGNAL